jgi:hypothetical protein
MVERIAPIRTIVFLLLAACGALCQAQRSSVDLLLAGDSNLAEVQRQQMATRRTLPDAPSVNLSTQAGKLQVFVNEARSPFTPRMFGINAGIMSEKDPARFTHKVQPTFIAPYEAVFAHKESGTFFDEYLYPSLLKRNLRYRPSTSGSFAGRATYAASRIFITHEDSGRDRLNSSYFLGVLTSVAMHTAYRPYWARSTSTTFNNFGSTIGSDAGINLFHEFGPSIQQVLKGRAPKIESGIGKRHGDGSRRIPPLSIK